MKKESVLKRTWSFTKELVNRYIADDALNLGAALAYYTVFSFAPLLVVATAIAGAFFGEDAVAGNLYGELAKLLGKDAAISIEKIVSNAYQAGDTFWATAISVGALIFAATGVFVNLQISLNKLWRIKSTPENSLKAFLKKRLLSFGFVIGVGFLLMVTLVVNAVVLGFVDKIAEMIPTLGSVMLGSVSWLLATLITAMIFAMMFRFLPDATVRWRSILVGSLFTAILFGVGRLVIGFYLGNSDFSSTYGAAGALMTLLVWTYYNSQILFLGAVFTAVWAQRSGDPILPDSHAVKIRTEEVEFEGEEV